MSLGFLEMMARIWLHQFKYPAFIEDVGGPVCPWHACRVYQSIRDDRWYQLHSVRKKISKQCASCFKENLMCCNRRTCSIGVIYILDAVKPVENKDRISAFHVYYVQRRLCLVCWSRDLTDSVLTAWDLKWNECGLFWFCFLAVYTEVSLYGSV